MIIKLPAAYVAAIEEGIDIVAVIADQLIDVALRETAALIAADGENARRCGIGAGRQPRARILAVDRCRQVKNLLLEFGIQPTAP